LTRSTLLLVNPHPEILTGLDPAPLLLKPSDLALDQLALERGGAVEEDDAVAVVGLVEHAARFEVEAVELEFFAVETLRADDGPQAPLHLKEDAREREAAVRTNRPET